MQTVQGSMLQSLRAVQSFLQQNAVALGTVVNTGARRTLDTLVDELTTHASDQSGGDLASRSATRKHRSLRQALMREHITPIARIARAELPQTPDIEPLKMPKGYPTAARLAAYAEGMAKAAAPFSDAFVDAGLPPDFIDQLHSASDAMLQAMTDRTQNRGRRGGATVGLKKKLSRGRKVVGVLDAFVQISLKDNPSLLASWNMVKRVQKTAPGPVRAESRPVPLSVSSNHARLASPPATPLPPAAAASPAAA